MHNYLLFPEVARTLEILASGEIGPVEVVILNWLGVPDLPGNVAYRPAWRHDPAAAGGGVLMDMLHIVYLAEAMLGAPIERVSAWVTARAHGAPVEDIAVCRFETAEAAALVNVGWGVGMGGYAISGSQGRIEVAYRAGSNGGWEPVERFQVHGRNGITEVTNVPFVDGAQPLLVDLADAIRDSRPPIASGAQGAHILEATLAAYASAATGRTWSLPLVAGEPLYERGVAGLREFDLDPSSTVA
ncbi:MAG TPA: Gfo/Idh/MocA family oxidoreductase, partial [Candidatus Limnocylindrales bacterium]|nr:Gfo/Idh/MocA family oxidoreductase [Candidatus Limnocylindrales bacterium]